MGTCAADSTVVEIWREHSPSSYSLKINKLSQLNSDKYKSRRFLSCGYNWRLIIYPKGNEKDNGNGFISMYVEFDDTNLMSTSPSEVFAYLVFFVYNKKANKYFTIQDVEVKRFNALRTVWGLPQVLSLGIFNDPKNGYIFEGEQFICWHDESNSGTGHDQIVSMAKLREAYLDRDTLSIEIEFEVVSSTSYSGII